MDKININKLYIYILQTIFMQSKTPFTQDYMSLKYRKDLNEANFKEVISKWNKK